MTTADIRPPDLNHTAHRAFHIEEYRALRAEIAAATAEMARLERLCATGCALIWVWLFGVDTHQWTLLAFVPTLIVGFGCVRSWALYRSILCIAAYIERLESIFALQQLGGWENFIRSPEAPRAFGPDHKSLQRVSTMFWAGSLLITVTLGSAYAIWREPPPSRRDAVLLPADAARRGSVRWWVRSK
jgi:hypothetical protein